MKTLLSALLVLALAAHCSTPVPQLTDVDRLAQFQGVMTGFFKTPVLMQDATCIYSTSADIYSHGERLVAALKKFDYSTGVVEAKALYNDINVGVNKCIHGESLAQAQKILGQTYTTIFSWSAAINLGYNAAKYAGSIATQTGLAINSAQSGDYYNEGVAIGTIMNYLLAGGASDEECFLNNFGIIAVPLLDATTALEKEQNLVAFWQFVDALKAAMEVNSKCEPGVVGQSESFETKMSQLAEHKFFEKVDAECIMNALKSTTSELRELIKDLLKRDLKAAFAKGKEIVEKVSPAIRACITA